MSNQTITNDAMVEDDPLTDFQVRDITVQENTKRVYVGGAGPAVIVLHEIPGISPQVARFARWVRDAGFTVYMPSLFGRDGAVPLADEGGQIFQRVCISREFHVMAGGKTSPVVSWLRALAELASSECGGQPVGAVGMCFTGNFALSMMIDPFMGAAVACQPSLPLDNPGAIEMSDEDADAIAARLQEDDLTVRGYRFDGDKFCMASRFERYQEKFGDRFEGRTLPDSSANPSPSPFFAQHIQTAHSVVTQHLIDREGEPTLKARDEIIDYLKDRLQPVQV